MDNLNITLQHHDMHILRFKRAFMASYLANVLPDL